jgi:hypothetical protein
MTIREHLLRRMIYFSMTFSVLNLLTGFFVGIFIGLFVAGLGGGAIGFVDGAKLGTEAAFNDTGLIDGDGVDESKGDVFCIVIPAAV